MGTSGDYAPFSVEKEGALTGFDVTVARRFARDRGLALEFVKFRWTDLLADLEAGRFDIAMSGVTVRPERSLAGTFTVPVAESGAVVLVRRGSGLETLADLDQETVRLVVNAGGHLERVARAHLPHARLEAIANNDRVRGAIREGKADGAITDTLEAPTWLDGAPELVALEPFTRDRKAYLVRPERVGLAEDVSAWLLEKEADGTLARLRRELLGAQGGIAPAEPWEALLAAMDERLDLMPLVAEAKRAEGLPIRDSEREARVVQEALEAVREAARHQGRPTPDEAAVATLFRVQMATARQVQEVVLREAPAASPAPELEILRAALSRIGDRIASLLPRLPLPAEHGKLRDLVRRHLDAPGLDDPARERLVDALAALARREGQRGAASRADGP